jgi:hypothetical protein
MSRHSKALKTAGASLLAVSLIVAAGCSDTSWGAECDGQRMPAGVYINQVLSAYSEGMGKVDNTEQTNLWKNTIDGEDFTSWVRTRTQENVYEYFAAEKKFDEMGLSFDEFSQAQITYAVESQWSYYQSIYEENGIGKDSFQKSIENTYKRSELFNAIYGKDGSEAVPQEELLANFNQEYINLDQITLSTMDETGETALPKEEIEKLMEKAKGYQKRIEEGESIQTIAEEYQKEQQDSSETVNVNTNLTMQREGSNYSATFQENIKSASPGKPIVFEDDKSICLAIVNEVTTESQIFLQNESYLLSEIKSDEFEDRLIQWGKELNVTFNSAAVSRYDAKKLKITKS